MDEESRIFLISTMCHTCRDMVLMADQPNENLFVDHVNSRTGQPCPGELTADDMKNFPQWRGPEGITRLQDDLRKALEP